MSMENPRERKFKELRAYGMEIKMNPGYMQDTAATPLRPPRLSCVCLLYCTLEKEGRNQSSGESLVKRKLFQV